MSLLLLSGLCSVSTANPRVSFGHSTQPPTPQRPAPGALIRYAPTVPRYKLTIAYDGTDFHGWQRQFVGPPPPGWVAGPRQEPSSPDAPEAPATSALPAPVERPELRTVQGVLETAVRQVVREPVVVFGASRTDAGVHAKGQVCAFTTGRERGRGWPPERGTEPLLRAINARLPDDVLVLSCEETDIHFDPVKATSKGYSYTFHVSPTRPLFGRQYVYHVKVPVDAAAMDEAAKLFVGTHDFAAFAASGHGRLSTVRTIFSCSVRQESRWEERGGGREGEGQRIRLDISGNGFLWNMVRIIGGTLLEVGTGRRTLDSITRALQSGDRTQAGPTLPPTGLCLEWIKYGDAAP